jgi:hypothetical protein
MEALSFSADGGFLAVGARDGTIALWELAALQRARQLQGHQGVIGCLAFSTDGKVLASGGADTTVLLWPLSRGQAALSADVKALGQGLDGDSAAKADSAIRALVASGDEAVAFLEGSVRPTTPVTAEQARRILSKLDSSDFDVREKATQELIRLAPQLEPLLRERLRGNPSAESRQRIDNALASLARYPLPAEDVRSRRAVHVLEWIATPRARQLLKTLAEGDPLARQTQDARAALGRLSAQRP